MIHKLRELSAFLRERIKGQDEVIPRVVSRLQHGELGLTAGDGRPKASFLFLGPTGVGKTEITLAFTEYLLGPDKVIRFDMSEYQTQESIGRMIGRSRDDDGVMGQEYERTAGSGTILFDEIEKAHPRVLDLLLQILDAGRLTSETGRTFDLTQYYIVCTSNIGAAKIMALRKSVYETLERIVKTEAQRSLRPEIFARVTEVAVFNRLEFEAQVEIAKAMLAKEIAQQNRNGYALSLSDEVLSLVVEKGYHPRLGARPMRAAVEKLVRDAITDVLITSGSGSGHLTRSRDQLILASSGECNNERAA